jgi:hypothetical protein
MPLSMLLPKVATDVANLKDTVFMRTYKLTRLAKLRMGIIIETIGIR